MIAVIDAGLRLRSIRLEISSSSSARLRPFSNEDDIGNLLDSMYAYVEWIAAEFAEEKKNLEAKQLWAEEKVYLDQGQQKLDLETRKQRQGELWEALRALPRLADMLSNPSQAEISQKRRRMSGRPSQDRAQPSGRLGEKEGSWAGYLAAEADVLELITQAALERPSDTRVLAGTPCNPAIKNDDPTEIPPQQKTIGDDDLAGD